MKPFVVVTVLESAGLGVAIGSLGLPFPNQTLLESIMLMGLTEMAEAVLAVWVLPWIVKRLKTESVKSNTAYKQEG